MTKRRSKSTRDRNRRRALGRGHAPARSWAFDGEVPSEGWSRTRKMWFGIYVGSCLLVTAAAVIVAVLLGPREAVIAVSVVAPILFGVVGLTIFGIQPEDDDLVRIMAAG